MLYPLARARPCCHGGAWFVNGAVQMPLFVWGRGGWDAFPGDNRWFRAISPVGMGNFRALIRRHVWLAALLMVAALAMKALVPAGFMVAGDGPQAITVVLCHDLGGGSVSRQVTVPIRQSAGELPGKVAKGECPYATLSLASPAIADPVLELAALAFLMALGFGPVRGPLLTQTARFWPPRRGPPAPA